MGAWVAETGRSIAVRWAIAGELERERASSVLAWLPERGALPPAWRAMAVAGVMEGRRSFV